MDLVHKITSLVGNLMLQKLNYLKVLINCEY